MKQLNTESIDLSRLAHESSEVTVMLGELEGATEEGVPSNRWAQRFTPASGKSAPILWASRFVASDQKGAPRRWPTRFISSQNKQAPSR